MSLTCQRIFEARLHVHCRATKSLQHYDLTLEHTETLPWNVCDTSRICDSSSLDQQLCIELQDGCTRQRPFSSQIVTVSSDLCIESSRDQDRT